MQNYIALLRKDPDSDYGVEFPDFPGCITAGSTLDEAREMATEALAGHMQLMLEDGDPIPTPSSLEHIMSDPENARAVAFLVPAPNTRPRSVRVNITVPEDALQQIDAFTASHGLTRSAFLVNAALKAMRDEHP